MYKGGDGVSGREGPCGRPSCVTPKKATRISRKKLKSLKAALTISIYYLHRHGRKVHSAQF